MRGYMTDSLALDDSQRMTDSLALDESQPIRMKVSGESIILVVMDECPSDRSLDY